MATPSRKQRDRRRRRVEALEAALISLDRSRGPLFREIASIPKRDRGPRAEEPHLQCTRKFNRMRISDLEAIDIARAFHEKPHLKGKLPEVYERLASAVERLRDTEDAQPFDCPLLDGKKCMVHHVAKPIACLAWNPGQEFSRDGWHSLERRDKLNQELFKDRWELKAIPLQLSRFLEEEDRLASGPCGSTLRKRAMRRGELGRRAPEPELPARRGRHRGGPSAGDRRAAGAPPRRGAGRQGGSGGGRGRRRSGP